MQPPVDLAVVNAARAAFAAGESLFLTGPAGSGKTTVANELLKGLPDVLRTSPTGIAAIAIGGRTMASTFSRKHKHDIMQAKALLIDEVSMCRADDLERWSAMASAVRDDDRPWGGLIVLAMGDMGGESRTLPSRS